MGKGDISSVIDYLEFDAASTATPSIVHVSGDVYAVAYRGVDSDGWLVTFTIGSTGQIGAATIASFEFAPANTCDFPYIIKIVDSSNVFAIVYRDQNNDGTLITLTIANDGTIGGAAIDTFIFDIVLCNNPHMVQISGDIYAIVYEAGGSLGKLLTIDIDSVGQIGAIAVDTLTFDGVNGEEAKIINVSGTTYAIGYMGSNKVKVVTVDIQDDGTIAAAVTDSVDFGLPCVAFGDMIEITIGKLLIAYTENTTNDGFLITIGITAAGVIDTSVTDSLEFETTFATDIHLLKVTTNFYIFVYRDTNIKGVVSTISVTSTGKIGLVLDTLMFDADWCIWPVIINISSTSSAAVYAIAYQGLATDGFVKTVSIDKRLGVWRSSDAGVTWHECDAGNDPQRIAFGLYSEEDSLVLETDLAYIFYSRDNGSFTYIPSGTFTGSPEDLKVDPLIYGVTYVGTDEGLYKSFDYGGSFHLMYSGATEIALGALSDLYTVADD